MQHSRARAAFTLIELLVVIAIIAILAVVVVLTLNPAQLLAQSRDANRISDMATLNSALGLYGTDQSGVAGYSLGTASTSYISVYDPSASSTCGSLGLPALGTGQSWGCATSSTYRNASSTGWIPVNFQAISAGTPISNLPVDPVNQTSSGLFYGYATNGSQFEITSIFESQKYKQNYASTLLTPYYPEVNAKGSNLAISPLFNPSGLVGWWPLNEGSGSSTIDQSGNGNNGTWNGSTTAGSYYTSGKVGSYAGTFNGVNNYVDKSSFSYNPGSGSATFAIWEKTTISSFQYFLTETTGGYLYLQYGQNPSELAFVLYDGTNNPRAAATVTNIADGNWHFIVGVRNTASSQLLIYSDGVLRATATDTTGNISANDVRMGANNFGFPADIFSGALDDVRIYNRALSAAEVQALYNAEK